MPLNQADAPMMGHFSAFAHAWQPARGLANGYKQTKGLESKPTVNYAAALRCPLFASECAASTLWDVWPMLDAKGVCIWVVVRVLILSFPACILIEVPVVLFSNTLHLVYLVNACQVPSWPSWPTCLGLDFRHALNQCMSATESHLDCCSIWPSTAPNFSA